jgi:hypothetical protein
MTNTLHVFAAAAGVLCLSLAAAEGCGGAGVAPRGAVEAEAEAYRYARLTSDAAAISLDAAALALRLSVEADAAKRAGECTGSGREKQACQHQAALAALATGTPAAGAIDQAATVQGELRKALVAYEACTPGLVDRLCQLNALTRVAAQAPAVIDAVTSARKALRDAQPSAH